MFKTSLKKVQNKTLPGEIAFKLYDTYGFPFDLTADILRAKEIKVDSKGFDDSSSVETLSISI